MSKKPIYKRIVIKLSGEVMAGDEGVGIEPVALQGLAEELNELRGLGVEIAVVIGGGNLIRGAQSAAYNLERVTADYVGMLATIINGLALRDILEKRGATAIIQSALPVGEIVMPSERSHCLMALQEGKVVIFVGGTGNPYFTTDTAAVLRALEIGAEIVLKATKVDGVYDADPITNPGAVKFDRISYHDVLQRNLQVMDATAISLCMEHQLPVAVFNIGGKGKMRKILLGEQEGTLIS